MKAFLKEFFQVPEEGTVKDKVMVGRAVMTLVNVLVILAVLAVTAYAYFGVSATTPSIPVAAAHFEASLSVSQTDELGTTQVISNQVAAQHTISLKAGKTYKITLKPAGSAQGGFCILTASDCEKTYYTQQLGADASVSGGLTKKIEFTLFPTADTVLTIDTSWGTSAFYGQVGKNDERYIFSGESVTMIIAGVQLSDLEAAQEEENTTEQTETNDPTTPAQTTPAGQPEEEQTEATAPAETTVPETTE